MEKHASIQLESMSLEFGTLDCGLECPYCYTHGGYTRPESQRKKRQPLSAKEVLRVIDQALDLGLGGVGVIGPYEPIREQDILSLVDGLRDRSLRVTLFTKGTYMTEGLAERLCDRDVTLGITVHSLSPSVHDQLTRKKGSHRKMMAGLEMLLHKGYHAKPQKILIQSVIVRQNLNDLVEVWRWSREKSFVPFLERMTLQGVARESVSSLNVPPNRLLGLFNRIATIDRDEFGREWTPHPPWIGEACDRHLNCCHLTAEGYVQPCTGVDIPVGNVRESELGTILTNSKVIRDLRNIRETIKGTCRVCVFHDVCYGCRGQAYQLTGDYLASDPCCWNNPDKCCSFCNARDDCLRGSEVTSCAPQSITALKADSKRASGDRVVAKHTSRGTS